MKKEFLKYLLPSIISMVAVSAYSFADAICVGKALGDSAIAALTVAWPPFAMAIAIGVLLGVGGGVMYSISSNKEEKGAAFATAVVLGAISGLLIGGAGLAFCPTIADLLGGKGEIGVLAEQYLNCIFWAFPMIQLNLIVSIFLKNDGHPWMALVTTVSSCVLNIILDVILVNSYDLGVIGTGIATAICQTLSLVTNLVYAYSKDMRINFKLVNFKLTWKMLQIGFAAFILESATGFVTAAFVQVASNVEGGETIYSVITNWVTIATSIVMGIAQAGQPLISKKYGEGDKDSVKELLRLSVIYSTIAGVLFVAVGYILSDGMVKIFLDEEELVAETVLAFRIYLPTVIFLGITVSISTWLESCEEVNKSFWISLLHSLILPVGFILLSLIAVDLIWWAMPVAGLVSATIAVLSK